MKRMWPWLAVSAVMIVLVSLATYTYLTDPGRHTTDPEFSGLKRTVVGNTLFSPSDPSVEMAFDEQFEYIGGQKFILYGTADVEQHFFVELYPDGKLRSIFWIQFEAFLPDNHYTYNYSSSPLRMQIGDFDFFTDTAAGQSTRLFRLGWPGTDGYAARKFAADKGYRIPEHYAYARLVHLPDSTNRKELLIIVMADLAPMGWTAKALREDGESHKHWPEVEAAHLDWIKCVMKLSHPI